MSKPNYKMRHKQAAHRLFIRLWVSNCLFNAHACPIDSILSHWLKLLSAVCYHDIPFPEGESISRRGLKRVLGRMQRLTPSLLQRRAAQAADVAVQQ